MSGTILNTDGSVTTVNISDKTLMGAGKYYAKNSAGASDFLEMDICDIKKTLKNDSVEYITCIYQSNAGQGLNPINCPDYNYNSKCGFEIHLPKCSINIFEILGGTEFPIICRPSFLPWLSSIYPFGNV